MINTVLTQKALEIATIAHAGQADKAGQPYINHPKYLAMQMKDEYSAIVALLHDVVEDTSTTLEDLADHSFPPVVIDALRLLTHEKDVDYMVYISAIKSNHIASLVKLADLKHNSDLSRLPSITEKDQERVKKYQSAIELLQE